MNPRPGVENPQCGDPEVGVEDPWGGMPFQTPVAMTATGGLSFRTPSTLRDYKNWRRVLFDRSWKCVSLDPLCQSITQEQALLDTTCGQKPGMCPSLHLLLIQDAGMCLPGHPLLRQELSEACPTGHPRWRRQ